MDLLTYPIYIFVFLTRLFFNPHTVHSDVGGTHAVPTFWMSVDGLKNFWAVLLKRKIKIKILLAANTYEF